MKKTKTILGAAVACAALASIVAPASARSAAHAVGCSNANLTKIENNMEAMADWGTKPAVAAEIAAASTALSNGDARGCAVHIGKAEHLEAAPGSY